jgi:hypothetical protein
MCIPGESQVREAVVSGVVILYMEHSSTGVVDLLEFRTLAAWE